MSGFASQVGSATQPRLQSEVERINERLTDQTSRLYHIQARIDAVADRLVGLSPSPPSTGGGKLEAVSSNTQHLIVDLERAIDACIGALSRLDNQGN